MFTGLSIADKLTTLAFAPQKAKMFACVEVCVQITVELVLVYTFDCEAVVTGLFDIPPKQQVALGCFEGHLERCLFIDQTVITDVRL